MRQEHRAGEKLFADYAGQTLSILDPAGGPAGAAHIFVAVLGASNYTYACATPAEGTADWIGGLVGALTYFGGVIAQRPESEANGGDRRVGYFGISEYYRPIQELDEWIRRRIRMGYRKQWRWPRTLTR